MEDFIRVLCTHVGWSFDEMIQQYNSNELTNSRTINLIINYKIENNKDIIYKEDIPNICSKYFERDISQEEFMGKVMRYIKFYDLDTNNLTIRRCSHDIYLLSYYMSTFLEHETVDIKIALKD
jgi:hypothetical protein